MRNPSIFALLLSVALMGADTAPLAEASIGISVKPAKIESLDSATLQKMAILKLANENRTVKRRVAELEKKLNLLLSSSGKNLYTIKTYGANKRKAPSIKSPVVRIYRQGDIVKVDRFVGNWALLNNGGYVHHSVIKPYKTNINIYR